MIKVTFEFATVDEASAFMLRHGGHVVPDGPPDVRPVSPTPPTSAIAEKKPAAKKAAPAKKAEPVAEKATPKAAPAGDTTAMSAFRELFNTQGFAVATGVLKEFGATRISDVKEADHPKFIKRCGEAA